LYTYIDIYRYIHIHKYVYVYIYIYTYITCTYIHINIYMFDLLLFKAEPTTCQPSSFENSRNCIRFFAEYTFHPNPNTNTQSIMTNKRHDSYISFHVLILQLQSAHVPWLIDMTLEPHTLHLASHTSHLIHMSLSHLISYTDITMFYFGSALHLVKCWYNNY